MKVAGGRMWELEAGRGRRGAGGGEWELGGEVGSEGGGGLVALRIDTEPNRNFAILAIHIPPNTANAIVMGFDRTSRV